jgi:hypothetical protein
MQQTPGANAPRERIRLFDIVGGIGVAGAVLPCGTAAPDDPIAQVRAIVPSGLRLRRRNMMLKIAALCLGLAAAGGGLAAAQDIAGIEDCTKTSGLDRRTGCLQANVNFLQQLVTKNALEARQRLTAASNEIVALKSLVTSLQASVEQLQAAQKAAGDKKPEPKEKK